MKRRNRARLLAFGLGLLAGHVSLNTEARLVLPARRKTYHPTAADWHAYAGGIPHLLR